MKLSVEVIENAARFINPATKDRELDLRSLKVSTIENLGACLDQYDCIDLSDNSIRRFDGFPLLVRVKKILLNNNRINRIGENCDSCLPNLEWLILTNNSLGELGDIDGLSCLTRLECLSLLNNPLTTKKYYRQYVIHKLPKLRLLDFRKVKKAEREEAASLFKGKKGKLMEKEIGIKSKTFITASSSSAANKSANPSGGKPVHTAADVEAIKAAIAKAKTLEEIERLNQLLKAGYIPGRAAITAAPGTNIDPGMDIDENHEPNNQ